MADVTDREFLVWLHERLEYVYKERPTEDYMQRLRAIAVATPPNQIAKSPVHQIPLDITDSTDLRVWYLREKDAIR